MAENNEVTSVNDSDTSNSAHTARVKQRVSPLAIGAVVTVLTVVLGAGYWFKTGADADTQPESSLPMVVVLDSAQLAMIRLDRVKDLDLDKEQVQQEAQDFASELGSILAEYEDSGIIVLNKSVALSSPQQFDITPLVARRMGLEQGSESR